MAKRRQPKALHEYWAKKQGKKTRTKRRVKRRTTQRAARRNVSTASAYVAKILSELGTKGGAVSTASVKGVLRHLKRLI